MSRCAASRWCGAFAGLALLCSAPLCAEEALRDAVRRELRDTNYVLVEYSGDARLCVLSDGVDVAALVPSREPVPDSTDEALAMTRSTDVRSRVRGLTLLAGVDDAAARDAALSLLSDPAARVREEAYQLLLDHPESNLDSIIALAQNDESPRVRRAVADLLALATDD